MSGTTLAIQDGETAAPRKITKIMPYSSGGFAVLTPYHREQRGYLAKHPVDYRDREPEVPRTSMIEYSAEDRVKLSIHADGFVQFSGERQGRITSGRDPQTGEPKGLGLITQPWSDPIATGPTFAVSVWGVDDFLELGVTERHRAIVFSEESLYFRRATPDDFMGVYLIEGFLFPPIYWQAVRKRGDGYVLGITHPYFELPYAQLEFQVVPMENQSVILGVIASRLGGQHPHAASGFALNGPSEFRRADALLAMYPSPWSDDPENRLDYSPDAAVEHSNPQP